ncbi:9553_t:CDS:2 [Ambispora leptoticha]|uniref:9553_t:CDS:1 n=1 Tax=Ambispora leptoticha TaxID=144679 RepID=A0A9N9GDI3_9GLOM|nr:9553_t:CDS:2 [Ambispora leptoticha]
MVTEVKSPKYHGKTLPDDMVKLENEMKDLLDKIIDDGIDTKDVVVCDLLVQDNLFVMDLKYDDIYQMILLNCFYLSRDHNDFGVFSKAAEVLMQVKMIMIQTSQLCVESLQTSSSAEDKVIPVWPEGSRMPPCQKMARPSYHIPIKVPLN